MSSGKPNWQKLHELGKLPKGARGNVPMLALLDKAEAREKIIREQVCDDCRKKIFGDEKGAVGLAPVLILRTEI